MKLFLSTLMASIAFTQARNLQDQEPAAIGSDLETRWKLENPLTQYVAAENKFTMTYTEASSANRNVNLRAAFFDGNCQDPVADADGVTPTQFRLLVDMGITAVGGTELPVPIMNDADIAADSRPVLEFEVDTLKLANTPEIYEVVDLDLIDNEDKPYGDDDFGKGVMTMCARFSLGYGSDPDYQEVNFIESVITIKYDLTAGFSVDAFAVEAKDKDAATAAKDSYTVIAYLCDAGTISTDPVPDGAGGGLTLTGVPAKITAFKPLNGLPDPNGSAFQQGSLVTVCVTPDALTVADGIVMGAITDFTWIRGDTEQVAVETNAETGAFEAASNGLSALDCSPQDVYCSFASILFADFYLAAGTVAGNGNANMEFKNTARRLKGGVEGERRQLQEAAAASPFDVAVGVTELDDGPGALKTAGGASMGFTALASAVALVSAALLA